jgi:hypothetical protein
MDLVPDPELDPDPDPHWKTVVPPINSNWFRESTIEANERNKTRKLKDLTYPLWLYEHVKTCNSLEIPLNKFVNWFSVQYDVEPQEKQDFSWRSLFNINGEPEGKAQAQNEVKTQDV